MDANNNTNGKTALGIINSSLLASGAVPLPPSRLKINISGHRYEITRETLLKYPSTRLGKLAQGKRQSIVKEANQQLYDDFDRATGEFFFERDPTCFPLIISYYKNGNLHIPRHVCVELFQEEMEYWGIPFHPNTCCQGYHQQEWEMIETVRKTNQLFDTKVSKKNNPPDLGSVMNLNSISKTIEWKRKVWDLFENSESSRAAYVSIKYLNS